jgi:peptide/nickel transport system substrate-binding protein
VDRLIDKAGAEDDEPARLAEMRQAFLLEKQDIGNIPLHQQPLTWAARKGIEMHQAPDNSFRLYLVTVP